MTQEEELQRQLTLNRKELELILAIDRVRDTATTPSVIFSGIVSAVTQQFDADFGLLYLVNRASGILELKILKERAPRWHKIGLAISRDAVRHAMLVDGTTIWQATEILTATTLANVPPSLQLLAVPIFMEARNELLGVLLLGRVHPFTTDERELLTIAESQLDSAIIQAYTAHELIQRNKELETIYRVDHIRDQNLPFDEMLNVVLQELCAIINAELGFVMLYDQTGQQLELRAVTNRDLLRDPAYFETINRVANDAIQRATMICHLERNPEHDNEQCAILCVPLILRDEVLGVFGAVSDNKGNGFTYDDQRLLLAIVSQMDTAIMENLERRQLRRVLGRSIDARVLQRLLTNPNVDILKGERALLTVLYSDLRGSTRLAEQIAPELMVAFLNDHLEKMTDVVLTREGTLDKFAGDGLMAFFGAPLAQPDHALRAVQVGLEMQRKQQDVIRHWEQRDLAAPAMGVGIATGELIVGEIGSERRTDYTVIGSAANLGARICAVAKPGQVLISEATYALLQDQITVTPVPGMHFKGIDHEVTVYEVLAIIQA